MKDEDEYTTKPTHLRIFSDAAYRDDGFLEVEWFIDGRDDNGKYTEMCWSYDSFEEAVSALSEFTTFYEFLESPPSIVLHVLVLVAALFHTTTWIALTPKVLVLWRDDERVEARVIVGANAVGFLAISAVVLWLVLG